MRGQPSALRVWRSTERVEPKRFAVPAGEVNLPTGAAKFGEDALGVVHAANRASSRETCVTDRIANGERDTVSPFVILFDVLHARATTGAAGPARLPASPALPC